MKTFTTLAAAAALISGIAMASAQTSSPSTNITPGSMSADNAPWCLTDDSNATTCKFASQEACQKEAKAQGQCVQNPKMGTTGSGGAMDQKK